VCAGRLTGTQDAISEWGVRPQDVENLSGQNGIFQSLDRNQHTDAFGQERLS